MKLLKVLLPALLVFPVQLGAQVLSRLDSLSLVQLDTLEAAKIVSEKSVREAATQTSLKKIDGSQIGKGFAALGTPDLIKSLQLLPGVSSGSELMSGLYVRGGDGSDNLFLLDGVPMYQVSHVIGLFSSFNTDVIDEVDFYKGGFPARYGGRLSSVVDVAVKDGDFERWHGGASLGVIDGRIQIEGPIIPGKTSLNFGMRRTWTDVVKSVAMLFIKQESDMEMAANTHYDFGDFNLKIVHKINENNKLSLSSYYGQDLLKAKLVFWDSADMNMDMAFRLKWGNTLSTLRWDSNINDKLVMDAQLYYTNYTSTMRFDTFIGAYEKGDAETPPSSMELTLGEFNRSRIYDFGSNVNFYDTHFDNQVIRFGGSAIYHTYDPTRDASQKMKVNKEAVMDESSAQSKTYHGEELSLFCEDEISLARFARINVGLRDALFLVEGRAYNFVEPRMSFKLTASDNLSFKGSFSTMNQFTHQVAASYLDLPTNIWMPSTAKVKPMHSNQMVLGMNATLPHNISLDIECFYKTMDHLYEYTGANTMLPQIDQWESCFDEGKGRAYGAEFSLEYQSKNFQSAVYYTLSKSERLYESFYYTWYPDRNDNRHKLTLTASYRFNKKFELYGAWVYHTGNRFTGVSAVIWDQDGSDMGYELYDSPNNYTLPAYHRLDLGFNWHTKIRRKYDAVVTMSVYNAYNHLNPMFGFIQTDSDGRVYGVSYGIIPIIPSLSYCVKF